MSYKIRAKNNKVIGYKKIRYFKKIILKLKNYY